MEDETIRIFVTMKALPETNMFDWQRMVEELFGAVVDAISHEQWADLRIYGPNSSGYESMQMICCEAKVTVEALDGLRNYLKAQAAWLLPVGIFVVSKDGE